MAHEANDPKAARGMRSGDLLRSSRTLEETQHIRLRLREQKMQRKTVGAGVPAYAS